jgi:MSHA biogenesis protein MshJ
MNALFTQWTKWDEQFAALTRRERVIVAAAAVFGGGFLLFNFGIDPFLTQARSASRAEAAARAELVQQQTQISILAAGSADPDAANRRRLAEANKGLAAVGERIATFEAGMVTPARMQGFLEGLLARNPGIELLDLKTLPPTLVGVQVSLRRNDAASGATAQGDANASKDKPPLAETGQASGDGIYQHGIEIRLAGSYNDLLAYMADLERMPQRLMWNRVSLTVEQYPRNIMVLRLYTLSFDKNWLVV